MSVCLIGHWANSLIYSNCLSSKAFNNVELILLETVNSEWGQFSKELWLKYNGQSKAAFS